MPAEIEQVGDRLYLVDYPKEALDRLALTNRQWDGVRREWWYEIAERDRVQAVVDAVNNGATVQSMQIAARLGLDPATPPAIVADALQEHKGGRETDQVKRLRVRDYWQRDPKGVRVIAKVRYRNRIYFVSTINQDNDTLHLASVPSDAGIFVQFWANAHECELLEEYPPRADTMAGVTVYTLKHTLESAAKALAAAV